MEEPEYDKVEKILRKVYKECSFWLDPELVNETIKAFKKLNKKRNTPPVSGSLLMQAKELFSKLTDDERMEVISEYCILCGKNEKEKGKCYCAPCYDE